MTATVYHSVPSRGQPYSDSVASSLPVFPCRNLVHHIHHTLQASKAVNAKGDDQKAIHSC